MDGPHSRSLSGSDISGQTTVGNNVYNRISFKLKKLRVENTPDMWIKKEGAFESIVPPDVFYTAQGIVRARAYRRYVAHKRNPVLRCARAKKDETLLPLIHQVWQSNMKVWSGTSCGAKALPWPAARWSGPCVVQA